VDALARSWKLFVLIVASVGAYAFFQPFYVYEGVDLDVSAYRVLVGYSIEEVGAERLGIPPDQVNTEGAREKLRELNEWVQTQQVISYNGWSSTTKSMKSFVPWYFLSAAVLLAIAFYAFVERKLRTGAAWVVVLASMPALWGFARAWKAITASPGVGLGLGALLLGATGVVSLAVGIAALVREDPGGFFKNAPTDDDEIVEELEDPHGRRTRRDPRDL
jgi:hypothetical protein